MPLGGVDCPAAKTPKTFFSRNPEKLRIQSVLQRAISTNTAIHRGIRKSNVRRNEGKDRSRHEEVRGTNYAMRQKNATKKLSSRSRESSFEHQQKQDTYVGKKPRRVRDEHRENGSKNFFPGSDSRPARNRHRHSSLKKDPDRFSSREESPAESMNHLPRNPDGARDPLLKQSKRGSFRRQQRDIQSRSPPLPSYSSNKLARAKKRAAADGLGNGVSGNFSDYSAVQRVGGEDTTVRSTHLIKNPTDQRESFIYDSNPGRRDKLREKQSSRYDKPYEVSLQDPDDWGLGKAKSNAPLSIPYTTPASEFLYGTSVIASALEAQRRKLYKLYIYDGENREIRPQEEYIRKLALTRGVEVVKVKGNWVRLMDKMSTGRPHNGYILEASPLPKLPVTGLELVPERKASFRVSISYQSHEEEAVNGTDVSIKSQHTFSRYPFILLLDGILDPGNLGAVLRTAFFLGADAVAISSRNSAPLSPVTLKASAGSCEALPILSVSHVANFIDDARNNGWKFYAATAPVKPGIMPSFPTKKRPAYYSTSTLRDPTQNHPCVLMLGGEGEGLRPLLLKKADYLVGVEGNRAGQNGVDSLNVSVAAGLLCDAFLKRPAEQNLVMKQPIISEASSSISYGPIPIHQMESVATVSEISTPDSSPENNSSGMSASNSINDDNINANDDSPSPSASNSDTPTENVEVSGPNEKNIGRADGEAERLF